jgi:hypothetical protein
MDSNPKRLSPSTLVTRQSLEGILLRDSLALAADRDTRGFYHLKKDVFPFVYWNYMLRGQWFGPKGVVRPDYA